MKLPGGHPGLSTQVAFLGDDFITRGRNRSLGSLFLVLLLMFQCRSSNAIRLQRDGGYVDIVVAIDEAVPVEPELIEQIKVRTTLDHENLGKLDNSYSTQHT
ncbi:hypothetical protein HPB50_001796 [Hyalomma asiaticum]|uniref:Uncharacterized protein n=1 Tax=Hyalomma asiaticum TaxID=266040 RepID=A0ACB7SBF8_HYAAI|nr:hypothetical protein HPB50_001796 [Hyalomma asiaticum]